MRGTYEPIPPHFSKDLSNLLALMIKVDPNMRLDINQLISLPLLQEHIVEAQMSMGRVDPGFPSADPRLVKTTTTRTGSSSKDPKLEQIANNLASNLPGVIVTSETASASTNSSSISTSTSTKSEVSTSVKTDSTRTTATVKRVITAK